MRIRNITIRGWRHFENIEIQLEDDTGLVCIVGANGTGKSHMLELIASCAHKLGVSQGVEIPRGDPFSDFHDFSLQFFLAEGVSDTVDQGIVELPNNADWDRTLTIHCQRSNEINEMRIIAGGIGDATQGEEFARPVVQLLKQSTEVHFLSLDSDRSYPKKNIHVTEIGQAYEIDWDGAEYMRGRSFKATATLYDEWLKYFLAKENQSGSKLIMDTRRARQAGEQDPIFADHFLGYKNSLSKVLPHIVFMGVNSKQRTLQFDTTGLELTFDQLSGGERELAFLIGQIDRFQLRHGLFLLDEPELHLNADLIRSWVEFLSNTVITGQIWLATHSLEAVEEAGKNATFVLERDIETRQVNKCSRLDQRPVLAALSRAVGTPAFSISQLLFVFIEGKEGIGERERFRKLTKLAENVRFMECGSSSEIIRRVEEIKDLAEEADAGIRITGVVDRDHKTDAECDGLQNYNDIYILRVHEIENFFLHPETLQVLINQSGIAGLSPHELIQSVSDRRAGIWIFQHAMATKNAKSLPKIPPSVKEYVKNLSWENIDADRQMVIQQIIEFTEFEQTEKEKFANLLNISSESYGRRRVENNLWKKCEGKQVLNQIAQTVGFAGVPTFVLATFAVWERDGAELPEELNELREHITSL